MVCVLRFFYPLSFSFFFFLIFQFFFKIFNSFDKTSNSSLLVNFILKTISSLFDFKIVINSFTISFDDNKPCSNNLANLSI